jgi:hypothetical protein
VSHAIAARIMGEDYQGRVFLLHAPQLRVPGSNIAKVGYEHALIRAFDDVTVHYEKPVFDERYGEVDVDFMQVKYQVRQGDEFTWEALTDPVFINASAVSILKRLRDAVAEQARLGLRARFFLLAPRPIGGNLRLLMNNAADAIDLGVLFDGSKKTWRSAIRTGWREHLELSSDEELRTVLQPLRIRQIRSLEELRQDVDIRLAEAGLRRWDGTERASRYDDLPRKLVQSGLKMFDRAAVEQLFASEGFIVGPPMERGQPPRRLGIRSYLKHAERMENDTDAMCDLQDCFDGRVIKDHGLWGSQVLPRVEQFLTESTGGVAAVDLVLASHATIAFAAGWHFNLKAQVDIAPVQNGVSWRSDPRAHRPERLWRECQLESLRPGPDVALCISSTHDVQQEARGYISGQLPQVGALLHLLLPDGPAHTAVRDGTHAYQLADAAVRDLVPQLGRGPSRGAVHIFIAAPNALVFFLGRMAHRLGTVIMYEHDLKGRAAEPYVPSLQFE